MEVLEESDAFENLLQVFNHGDPNNEIRKGRIELEKNMTADPEYKALLSYILSRSESVVQGKRSRENDSSCQPCDDYYEELPDPQYEEFLKCLTEHENSYILTTEENGVPVVIKYEEKLHLDEDCDREPRRKLSSSVKRPSGTLNQIPGVGHRYECNSESTETRALTRRILRSNTKTNDKVSTKYASNGSASHYVTPRRIAKVEHEENLFQNFGPAHRTRLRSGMKQNSSGNQCRRDLASMDETKNVTGGKSRTKTTREMAPDSDHLHFLKNCDVEGNQCKRDLPSMGGTKNVTGGKSRTKATCDMALESDYLHFLKNCHVEGDDYAYSCNGLRIVYGGNDAEHNEVAFDHDNESLSDVEIIEGPNEGANNMKGNASNAIPAKATGFREQLVKLLKKPYNKEEHEKLLQDMKFRRPVEHVKDLRYGRQRRCSNNIEGKSYLDNYPDLNRKLSQYKHDKPTSLNLLRGFFFWLQNGAPITEEEGSFFPWKDAECISTKPGSC